MFTAHVLNIFVFIRVIRLNLYIIFIFFLCDPIKYIHSINNSVSICRRPVTEIQGHVFFYHGNMTLFVKTRKIKT